MNPIKSLFRRATATPPQSELDERGLFPEERRDGWALRWSQNFRRDVVLAWRRMGQHKGFAAVIVLTFALAVGLNTLMFNLFNSLWFNPGLYPEEERIVRVYETFADGDSARRGTSPLLYVERMEQSALAEEIALTFGLDGTVTSADPGVTPEYGLMLGATPSLFRVLGVDPLIGRVFNEAEAERENDGVAVLFHAYWERRYNSDPSAIGKTIFTDGRLREIIGVMPASFRVPEPSSDNDGTGFDESRTMIVPFGPRTWWDWMNAPERRYVTWAGCFARLAAGVTPQQFRHELEAINARNGPLHAAAYAEAQRRRHQTEIATINQDLLRENRSLLYLLQSAIAFVLVIGCVNIVSLVLSRNSARRQEFALRLSFGAGRARLGAQLVTEVWLLALIGGGGGLLIAATGLRALDAIGAFKFFVVPPRVEIDWLVAAYTLLIASAAGIVAGLCSFLPLLRDRGLGAALAEDGRTGTAGREPKRFRAALLATEIGFTMILLVGGALLLRSFSEILRIDPGYETDKVLTGAVRLPPDRYDEEATKRFIADFERRLQDLPGVAAAGITNWPPLKLSTSWPLHFIRRGSDYLSGPPPGCIGDTVGVHYFDALNIRVLKGRVFTAADYSERSAVAVIDQRVADAHFPNEDPIGQMIAVPFQREGLSAETQLRWLRVIGVVAPIRVNDLLGYSPIGGMVYQTYVHQVPYWAGFVIRTEGDPALLLSPLRQLLAQIDPQAAVAHPETMADAVKRRYSRQQTFLTISLAIAGMALLICTVGVYGMLAHSVSLQSKEIAIRRALGARDLTVMRDVLAYWLKAAAIGLVVGVVVASLTSTLMAELLYRIAPMDVTAYAGSILVLTLTVLLAAGVSARRAVALNIVEVLRR